MERLDSLIELYITAINARNIPEIERLCHEVEKAATAIGYTNHARLHALHTLAEEAAEEAETEE